MLAPDHSAESPKYSTVNSTSLRDDLAENVTLSVLCFGLMVGWDRASSKHLGRAVALYRKPYVIEQMTPLMVKAHELLAVDGLAPRSVMDFVRSVDLLGFDESHTDEPSAEFRELIRLLIEERSCLDFTISLQHRRALGNLAKALGQSFETLAHFGAVGNVSSVLGHPFNTLVNCLTLVDKLPLMIVCQATERGASRGPLAMTAHSIGMGIVLHLAASDPLRWDALTSACLRRLRNFNCPGHTDLDDLFLATLRSCRDRARQNFSALYSWCQDYARRESVLTLIRSIPDTEDVDPIYWGYIDIPTPYSLTVRGPLAASKEMSLTSTLTHPYAYFELSMSTRPELGTFSWMMDSQGEIRHSVDLSCLPFSEVDFNITPEEYDSLAALLRRASLARLEQIGIFIEDNFAILAEEMPRNAELIIERNAKSTIVFGIGGAESVASRCSVRTPHTETTPVVLDEAECVDADSPLDETPSRDTIDSVFRRFGRPTFSQLLGVLKEFGVEFRTTNGSSHRQLWRNGYHYTAGPNLYGDVFKLYPSWVQRILARLHIPEDEFLKRFCK